MTTNRRARRRTRAVVSSSRRFRALLLTYVVVYVASGGVSGFGDEPRVDEIIGRTSFYSRPEYASDAVELEPMRRRRRRLITADEREEDSDEKHFKPKQVHLSISGDEEVTVVWTTRKPFEEEKDVEVRYACVKRNSEDEEEKDVINRVVSSKTQTTWHLGKVFESSSYTQQMCLASATSLTAPSMGGLKKPVSRDVSEAREYVELGG